MDLRERFGENYRTVQKTVIISVMSVAIGAMMILMVTDARLGVEVPMWAAGSFSLLMISLMVAVSIPSLLSKEDDDEFEINMDDL